MNAVRERGDDDLGRTFWRWFAALVAIGLVGGVLLVRLPVPGRGADPAVPVMKLESLPTDVAHSYRFAATHMDTMQHVPCYCGCDTLGHRHLGDCFVAVDGGWEPHAAGCAVCLAEARQVESLAASGLDAEAIRARIIDQFGATFGPMTTP